MIVFSELFWATKVYSYKYFLFRCFSQRSPLSLQLLSLRFRQQLFRLYRRLRCQPDFQRLPLHFRLHSSHQVSLVVNQLSGLLSNHCIVPPTSQDRSLPVSPRFNQPKTRLSGLRLNPHGSLSNSQVLDHLVNLLCSPTEYLPLNHRNSPLNLPITQLTSQHLNLKVNHQHSQLIDLLISHQFNRPINLLTSLRIIHPRNLLTNHPISQPLNPLISQQIDRNLNLLISHLFNQPINLIRNHMINQPPNLLSSLLLSQPPNPVSSPIVSQPLNLYSSPLLSQLCNLVISLVLSQLFSLLSSH